MKLLNFFKRDNRSKVEIYQNAMKSYDFDYSTPSQTELKNEENISFSDALKFIPEQQFSMQEIDYFA